MKKLESSLFNMVAVLVVVALITSIIVNFYGEMKKTEEEDK